MRWGGLVPAAAGLVAMLALAGCGNDSNAKMMGGLPVKELVQAALAEIGIGPKTKPAPPPPPPTAAQLAATRKVLEAAGMPLYLVQEKDLHLAGYLGKLGQNGDVVTWSTKDYKSVSMRNGMVVATRGLGPDIMSSSGPTTAQIARGKGETHRSYYYLDTADKSVQFDYTCQLSEAKPETISLLGKAYRTRRVNENCHGSHGSFVNSYWFDTEAKLRQSSQLLAPGIANLLLQRIIG